MKDLSLYFFRYGREGRRKAMVSAGEKETKSEEEAGKQEGK